MGQGEAPPMTSGQVHLYTAANWALLLVDALVGVLILVVRWHTATTITPIQLPPPATSLRVGESRSQPSSPVPTI
jgi:hypothetical protein